MSGYDLREDEEPANMSMYNNYYSTDLFADKAIDLIQKHDTNKVGSSYILPLSNKKYRKPRY
jgi:hypothetical protein